MIDMAVGTTAAVLTMFSFVPQVVKSIRTRSAKDISVITLFQLASGVSLWVIYGIHRRDPIIIAANSATLISLLMLIFLYFYFKKKKE